MNTVPIALAEENVKKRAEEAAYKMTELYTDHQIQKELYRIYRDLILLGSRLMQEELMNLKDSNNNE